MKKTLFILVGLFFGQVFYAQKEPVIRKPKMEFKLDTVNRILQFSQERCDTVEVELLTVDGVFPGFALHHYLECIGDNKGEYLNVKFRTREEFRDKQYKNIKTIGYIVSDNKVYLPSTTHSFFYTN